MRPCRRSALIIANDQPCREIAQHDVTDAVTSIQNKLHIAPDQGITSQISGFRSYFF